MRTVWSHGWRNLLVGLTLLAGGTSLGCSDKLDTGYEPRRLGATPIARRGYYASPFTPEAAAAEQNRGDDDLREIRRPGVYR